MLHYRARTAIPRFGTQGPLSVDKLNLEMLLKWWAGVVSKVENPLYKHAFFCSRTMLVHFFSSSVSYPFAVVASNISSLRLNSSLSTAAVFCRLFADRYAMIDLCLGTLRQSRSRSSSILTVHDAMYVQLFSLAT